MFPYEWYVRLTTKKYLSTVVKIVYLKTTANVRGYLVLVSGNDHKCEISRGILAPAALAGATRRRHVSVQGIRRHTYKGR